MSCHWPHMLMVWGSNTVGGNFFSFLLRRKGLATLRNVPNLLFWDKIGHAKSVGFVFYSAIWRNESRISSRYLEITSICLIYSLTYSRKEEILFWISRGLNRLTCVTRQIRGDSKGLFTWSGGPRSSGVSFFCFHALGDTKQKKLTPLDRGPPLHVNRV